MSILCIMTVDFIYLKLYIDKQEIAGRLKGVPDMRNVSSMNHVSSQSFFFRFMQVRFAGRIQHSQKLSD
jgi:hypothetical protein